MTGVFEVVGLRWSRLPPQYPGDPSRVAVHHATLSAIRVVRDARDWDPETEIAYFPSAHGLALEVGERYLLSFSPSQRPGFFTGTQTREQAGVLKAARLPTEDVLAHLGATCEGGAQ